MLGDVNETWRVCGGVCRGACAGMGGRCGELCAEEWWEKLPMAGGGGEERLGLLILRERVPEWRCEATVGLLRGRPCFTK